MFVPLSFIAGIALLWLGLRGRRLDDHPVCARCGYDLVGRAGDSGDSQASQFCPECASDTGLPGGTRTGNRRRLSGLIVAGGLLTAISVVVFATTIWLNTAGLNALVLQPFWMVRLAALGNGSSAVAAQQELVRRMANRALDASSVQKLLGDALARQIDLTSPWQLWGDIFDAADACGAVSPAQLQTFNDHRVQVKAEPRRQVVAGAPIRFDITTWIRGRPDTAMNSAGGVGATSLRVEVPSISLDKQPLAAPATWIYQIGRDRSAHRPPTIVYMTGRFAVLPDLVLEWVPCVVEGDRPTGSPYPAAPDTPGPHRLRATFRVTPGSGVRYVPPAGPWTLGNPSPSAIEVGVDTPIEILAASSPDLRAVHDDDQLDDFAGGLRVQLHGANPEFRYVGTPPVGQRHLAFQVFLERRRSNPVAPDWPGNWTFVGYVIATRDGWSDLYSSIWLSPDMWSEVQPHGGPASRFMLRPTFEVAQNWFTAGEVTVGKDIVIEGKDLSGSP